MEQLLELDSVNFANTLVHKGVLYSIFTAKGSDGIWIWFVMSTEDSSIADISQVPLASEQEARKHFANYANVLRQLGWVPLKIKAPAHLLALEDVAIETAIEAGADVEEETKEFPLVQKSRWNFFSWIKKLVGR